MHVKSLPLCQFQDTNAKMIKILSLKIFYKIEHAM